MRLKKFLQDYKIEILKEYTDAKNPGILLQVTNLETGLTNQASYWDSQFGISFGHNFSNPKKFRTLDPKKCQDPILEYVVSFKKFQKDNQFQKL
jgi:hypothetical protein